MEKIRGKLKGEKKLIRLWWQASLMNRIMFYSLDRYGKMRRAFWQKT